MAQSIISEGKTTNEAIENGLKKLNVSKDMVNIKVLEEEKKSFFSILTPRVVKVELTVKEKAEIKQEERKEHIERKPIEVTQEDIERTKSNLENFLKSLMQNMPKGTNYKIEEKPNEVEVSITGEDVGYLIGYRGETLYAVQNVLSAIANKNTKNRVRILLDIEGYKEKRLKTLENLAQKLAGTVIRTGRSVTLEPMQPYERKIIHSKLQGNKKVTTYSIGEEPRRKVVIALNKKK